MMDLRHYAAVLLTAAAGVAYLWAACRQWLPSGSASASSSDGRWWWIGIALQTAGLAIGLCDPLHRSFAYGALAGWATVAAIMFAGRFLTAPARLLLALPLGAVILLVAIVGLTQVGAPPEDGTGSWISRVHAGFMAAHLAAVATAGAAGALYLLTAGRLKAGDPRVSRLPSLPVLERLVERGLIWGTALLTGGLATGGAAIRMSQDFQLLHPTAMLGLAECFLLATVLGLHRTNRLSRRALSIAAIACLTVGIIGTLSQVVVAHG